MIVRRSVFLVAVAFVAALLPASGAFADTEEILGCSELHKAFERDDGAIIALGTTANCGASSQTPIPPKRVLVGLESNGELLSGFGDGGITRFANGSVEVFVERPDGGAVVRSGDTLIAFDRAGKLDPTFGTGGRLSYPGMLAARGGLDGGLYLVRGGVERTVAKFDFSGNPDTSFGEGGELTIGMVGITIPAIDSQGRILFTQGDDAIRLLPDGTPDSTFGPDPDGRVEMDVTPGPPGAVITHGLSRVEVGHNDSLFATGTADSGDGTNRSYMTGVDSSGAMLPWLPTVMEAPNLDAVAVLEDGVAFSWGPNRFETPSSSFKFSATGWSAPLDVSFTKTPKDASILDITALADGSILAVGQSYGSVCPRGKCVNVSRMVVAKATPSGILAPDFGAGGKVVLPGKSCEGGTNNRQGDWNACFIKWARPRGSVKLHARGSARPWILFRVGLGTPPGSIGQGKQKLDLKLPNWIGIRSRERLRATTVKSSRPGVATVRIRGRHVKVFANSAEKTDLRVRIPRGAITIGKGVRDVEDRKIRALGQYVPYKGSPDATNWSVNLLPIYVRR